MNFGLNLAASVLCTGLEFERLSRYVLRVRVYILEGSKAQIEVIYRKV
jgi:hypothetical protein